MTDGLINALVQSLSVGWAALRRRQARRVVEGGARERRHTRTQHGEATACRRVRQRDSLQEGGAEREGDREERGMLQGTYATRTMRRTGQAVGMSHHTCHTQQTHTQHTKTLVPVGTP